MSGPADHRALRDLAAAFAARELRDEVEARSREESFAVDAFRRAGDLGLLGLLAPATVGGSDLDAAAAATVAEELAAVDPGFALSWLSHAVLFVNGLARGGDPVLIARVLPDACSGRRLGAVAMSEAEAGSDLAAMRTSARPDGDAYILEGAKTWITNGTAGDGGTADLVLVYARTSDVPFAGLSLFLVERGTPGFTLGRRITGKLGMRTSPLAELRFDACRIPAANRLGQEGGALAGLARTFEIERLTLAAIALGLARRALEVMNDYASRRRIGGRPLRTLGQIQAHLAESYAAWAAARALVYAAAAHVDLDTRGAALECDAAKLFCGAMAKTVTDRAIQVLGANGYVEGHEVDRLWRDARLIEIGGGTSEVLQKHISRQLATGLESRSS